MIIIGLPLWGHRYIERWSDYSGQTLLAEGNLPALARAHDVEIQIVTTADFASRLEELRIVEAMRRICRVTIREMDVPTIAYDGMTKANVMTLNDALKRQSVHILTLGDQIWANGSLYAISERLKDSAAVLSWGGMLDRGQVAPFLEEIRRDQVIEIPPKRLAELTIRFPHPVQRNWIVEPGHVPRTPSSMMWLDPLGSGAVVRSHILIVHAIDFAQIDKNRALCYLNKLSRGRVNDDVAIYPQLFDIENVAIIQRSDEVITVSIDDDDRSSLNSPRLEVDLDKTSTAVSDSLRIHQPWEPQLGRYFFTIPYNIRCTDDELWAQQMIDRTFDLAVNISILQLRRSFLGSIWVRLPQRQKSRIVQLFNCTGLLQAVSKRIIGYELRRPRGKSL